MPEGLRLARFDSEAVVFNPVSWQTHLLNDTAAYALEALMSGPQTFDDIVTAVLGNVTPPDHTVEMIQSLLAELEALGLVETTLAKSCE